MCTLEGFHCEADQSRHVMLSYFIGAEVLRKANNQPVDLIMLLYDGDEFENGSTGQLLFFRRVRHVKKLIEHIQERSAALLFVLLHPAPAQVQ